MSSIEPSLTESAASYYYQHEERYTSDLKRTNEPEENLGPEFFPMDEPVVSKSFPYEGADKTLKLSNFYSF